MTAETMPCEGGCGCRLAKPTGPARALNGQVSPRHLHEVLTEEPPAPRAPWAPLTLGEQHNVARCLVIRLLREAAEDAAQVTETGDVVTGHGFVLAHDASMVTVRAVREDRWADATYAVGELLSAPRPAVEDLANRLAGLLRDRLERPGTRPAVVGPTAREVIIARDPRRTP